MASVILRAYQLNSMKNLLYSLALGALFTFGGCDKKKDEAKPTTLEQLHIVVMGEQTGHNPGPVMRVTLSQSPVKEEKDDDDWFFTKPFYAAATSTLVDDTKWDKVDIHSKTFYISLYYQDVLRSTFVAPASGAKAKATVLVDGKAKATVEIDAAAYNNPSLRWRDSKGLTHVGREVAFTY